MNQNNQNQHAVSEFYDDFSSKQVKTGLNLRHYFLAKELSKLKHHNIKSVLEIGCGIGTFTSLVAKTFPDASITGVDISEKNVGFAKSRMSDSKYDFFQSDFSEKCSLQKKYDLIVLADVLEHIPIERYDILFQNIADHCNENADIFINIPHPQIISYLRKTNPGALQIIDQPVTQDVLFPQFVRHSFTVVKMQDYALTHNESDYVLYVLKTAPNVIDSYHHIPGWKISLRKLRNRF